MGIILGGGQIDSLSLGTTPIKGVYKGSEKIWPSGWAPSSSTVVYYKFDGDVKDYSGNGYNLTIEGGALTYSSHYITIGGHRLYNSSSSITRSTTSDYTVVAWLRNFYTGQPSSLYDAQAGVLSAYTSDIGGTFPLTYLGVANGRRNTNVGTIMGSNALGCEYGSSTDNTTISVTGSSWVCVIVTLDRTANVMYFYKNGNTTPVFTKTNAGLSADTSTTGIQVGIVGGTNYGGNTRYYYGDMGEIILEKRKRSTDEISAYYNSTKTNYGIS